MEVDHFVPKDSQELMCKCMKSMWGKIALFLILFMGACWAFYASFSLKDDEELFLFFDFFIMVPMILAIPNFLLVFWRRLNDYVRVSSEEIEIYLHGSPLFWKKPIHEFYQWNSISQFSSGTKQIDLRRITYLALALYGNSSPRIYEIAYLKGRGESILSAINTHISWKKSPELQQKVESTVVISKKEHLYTLLVFVAFVAFCFSPYKNTLIPSWYIPCFALPAGCAFLLHCLQDKTFFRLSGLAFAFLSFCCFAFLQINYSFADWKAPDTIQSFPVTKADYSKDFRKNKVVTGYVLVIRGECGTKRLHFPLEMDFDLREATVVDLYLHKGFFCLPVFEKKMPRKGDVSCSE